MKTSLWIFFKQSLKYVEDSFRIFPKNVLGNLAKNPLIGFDHYFHHSEFLRGFVLEVMQIQQQYSSIFSRKCPLNTLSEIATRIPPGIDT